MKEKMVNFYSLWSMLP